MRAKTFLVWTLVLFIAGVAHAVTPSERELQMNAGWCTSSFDGKAADMPFSWKMNGATSTKTVGDWELDRSERTLDEQRAQKVIRLTDRETGLVVTCETTLYKDFPAVEWVLHIANHGSSDSPILSDVWPADILLPREGDAVPDLYYADGSQAQPTDFQPRQVPLPPNTERTFAPQGGRSSDGVMPYFTLARSGQSGVVLAIGWTGQWTSTFATNTNGDTHFQAGMERTHLRLHPGEEIRTPSILMMHYAGDRLHGQNLWRQLMLRHYTPAPSGRPPELPVAASGATIGFNNVTAANQIQGIETIHAKGLPVDTWWIDAGWSTGGFPLGMGTWEPDPTRFPDGLAPVSKAAHAAGLKFLVWFEPERVMPGTWLRKQHPEWLLTPSNLPDPVAYQKNWRLLDLGNSEARAWAVDTFSGFIDSWNIDFYRQDFNMHPLYYWRTAEPEDRQGMREICYIEGLYTYLDTLLQRHPGLLIDNCASGGRRLDFEMMRRSVPLWRTDYCWDPLGAQCISYGLAYWLVNHGLGAVSVDPYDFRSGMGTCATYAFDFYSPDAPFWPGLAERIKEYKLVRPCFYGDFYPLTPYDASEKSWMAWQYDRTDLGRGMIQAFRRAECPDTKITVKPLGLDADASYSVTNLDSGEAHTATGTDLMNVGVTISIAEPRSSSLYIYQRQK